MKAYVSYDINCEEIYDEDGEVSYGDEYWLISNVFVEKAFRGQGVARKLMTEAIAEMKAERQRQLEEIFRYGYGCCGTLEHHHVETNAERERATEAK